MAKYFEIRWGSSAIHKVKTWDEACRYVTGMAGWKPKQTTVKIRGPFVIKKTIETIAIEDDLTASWYLVTRPLNGIGGWDSKEEALNYAT